MRLIELGWDEHGTRRSLGGVISLSGGALDLELGALSERIPARFLITHGTKDRVLGKGKSVQLATAAEEAGHEVSFFPFDDGHTVSPEVLEQIVAFLGN